MKRYWNIRITVKNPAYQVGNVFNSGSNYGPGGMFPDLLAKPAQGLAMRVKAKGANGHLALVFFAGRYFPLPARLPIFFGTRLYLHPTTLVGTPLSLGVVASDTAEPIRLERPAVCSVLLESTGARALDLLGITHGLLPFSWSDDRWCPRIVDGR